MQDISGACRSISESDLRQERTVKQPCVNGPWTFFACREQPLNGVSGHWTDPEEHFIGRLLGLSAVSFSGLLQDNACPG